jgi:hypothetical protein
VLNIVDPLLIPLAYGRTRVLESCGHVNLEKFLIPFDQGQIRKSRPDKRRTSEQRQSNMQRFGGAFERKETANPFR